MGNLNIDREPEETEEDLKEKEAILENLEYESNRNYRGRGSFDI